MAMAHTVSWMVDSTKEAGKMGNRMGRQMFSGLGINIICFRFGTLTWPDGDSYVGAWEGGMRQGWGAYYWNNGNSYQVSNAAILLLHREGWWQM